MRRTILLISQQFPPAPLVGALRAGNVARAYCDAGYRVIVITAAMEGETPGLRQWQPGITVHAVAIGARYRERLTRSIRWLQSLRLWRAPARAGGPDGGLPIDGRPAGGGLRALLLSLVWIPDDELRFVFPAYRAARRLLRHEHVDLVYTSAPSHSTTLVGLLLKRLKRLRWCAEFRDPWCYPHAAPVTPLVERVNAYLEWRCISAADHLVTVTDQAADLYRERLGRSAGKVVVVRNGIPAVLARAVRRQEDSFRIVYGGNIYGGRDPREFLRAALDVARECAVRGTQVAVDIFVGEATAAGDVLLHDYVVQQGMEGIVRVHGWVGHAEIQRVLQGSDLLLLLAQLQPLQVPNKLYEYLGTGVPILAIADEHGETAHMLRQVGGHYVVPDNSAPAIAAALREAIYRRDVPSNGGPAELLEEWLTERQMRLLVAAVRP